MQFARGKSIFHQHSDGHRAYAAGNGSDVAGFFLAIFEIYIAAKLSVFVPIHTNVDNYRAFFDVIGGYHLRSADSGYENISLRAHLFKILRFRVANGDRAALVQPAVP